MYYRNTIGVLKMFGYVKAFKPYMRMYEYEAYRGVYCGVCKELSKQYGFVTRLPLSYDIAFLGLMELSLRDKRIKTCRKCCPLHPINKTVCLTSNEGLELTCAASVILTYHKLRDDMSDKGALKKIAAMALLPFFRRANRKASKLYPELSKRVSKAMKEQTEIEKLRTDSIDRAAHPTGEMMSAVFSELSDRPAVKTELERFGYLLGRFVYICDAIDDLEDDLKAGGYNTLTERFCKNGYDNEVGKQIVSYCTDSIMLTLGSLAESYVKLQPLRYKDITDNIIYLGLKSSYKAAVPKRKDKQHEQ